MSRVGTPAMLTVTVPDVGLVEPVDGVPVVGGVVPDEVAPTVAVTVAVEDVRSVVADVPDTSVVTTTESSEPAVVTNETGTPPSALPLMSNTVAEISDEPPRAGMMVGLALTATRPAAAEPTAILIAFVPLAETPPEMAVIVAVPLLLPATNFTVTRPLTSVSASAG